MKGDNSHVALLLAQSVGHGFVVSSIHIKESVTFGGTVIHTDPCVVLHDVRHLRVDQVVWWSAQNEMYGSTYMRRELTSATQFYYR